MARCAIRARRKVLRRLVGVAGDTPLRVGPLHGHPLLASGLLVACGARDGVARRLRLSDVLGVIVDQVRGARASTLPVDQLLGGSVVAGSAVLGLGKLLSLDPALHAHVTAGAEREHALVLLVGEVVLARAGRPRSGDGDCHDEGCRHGTSDHGIVLRR